MAFTGKNTVLIFFLLAVAGGTSVLCFKYLHNQLGFQTFMSVLLTIIVEAMGLVVSIVVISRLQEKK
jgi:hypothetical protein